MNENALVDAQVIHGAGGGIAADYKTGWGNGLTDGWDDI